SSFPDNPDFDFELPHDLSQDDLDHLREYMTYVKAIDTDHVDSLFDQMPSKDSADVLCSLWYLLPETREPISNAISSEYQRLGGATGAIEAYAYAANEIGDSARHAYESVAVTSNLGIGVPYEVLLRACGIEYNDWRDMCVAQKPVWGLLYDDIDQENQNLVYRTRNHIVTRVLVNLINAGRGHAGEFRVLKRLVSACTSSTVPYRTFLVDLLVKNEKKLRSMLTYKQGVELFQTALQAFPGDDDLIEHHFGIWHRVVGNDYEAAYDQFQKALEKGAYKYSGRAERKEFIHTSMGATIVDMVKEGKVSREEALESVRQHLREASHPSFFNPHTDHVFANLLFILAKSEAEEDIDAITLTSLAEALATIEHSLQMMGAVGKKFRRYEGSVSTLLQLQYKILGTVDNIDELISYAESSFLEGKNQCGFEIVVRRMLADVEAERRAGASNIGGNYKGVADYIKDCLTKIRSSASQPTPGFVAAKIDLTIRWRLQATRGPIDWKELRKDLEFVLESPQYRDDVVRMYYLAVALFHLGEFTEANSVFEILKRKNPTRGLRIGTRNYYVGKEGSPKRVQAEVRHQHDRTYAYIPEISLELEAFGPVRVGDTGIANCYVAFSLAGPTAQFGDLRENLELA
ncbi:MAG: hypothetical protein MI861_07290, partial [Pirellulales bacterium]|nr:hypothetical protein [Pirellulales bacterium]